MKKSSPLRNNVFVLPAVVLGLCAPALSRAALVAAWGDNSRGQTVLPQSVRGVKAVACGYYHTLALKTDGTVVTWGDDQAAVPAGLANVTAIAAGTYHNLALRSDGTVVLWSSSPYGQTNSLPGLSGGSKIAAGYVHNVALKYDGRVVVWGAGNSGQTNLPPDLTNVVAIAAAAQHTIALKSDGSVVAWGGNAFGQTNVPPGLSNVTAIAAGQIFNLALRADGTVVGWGTLAESLTNFLAASSNVVAMAPGIDRVLLVKDDGNVSSWSSDVSGLATLPPGLSNVTAVAAGLLHEVALTFEGPVQILQPLPSATAFLGSNQTFTVFAEGRGPLTYQWYYNGARITDDTRVTGAAGATLQIGKLQFSDAGSFTVMVSNAFGAMISDAATLAVVSPPYVISRTADLTVGAGTSVALSVYVGGTYPLTYQWTRSGTNVPGSTSSYFSYADAQPEHSGIYSLIISNAYGVISTNIALTVTNTAPHFTQLPTLTTTNLRTTITSPVVIGSSAALSVAAKSSFPISYQWRFNGVDLPGATNTVLLFNQLRYDQAGYYNVEVSNAFGSTNSAKLLLNVSQIMFVGTLFAGNTNMPLALSNVIAVAAGGSHVMALKSDGAVRTWLANPGYIFDQASGVTNVPASVTNVIAAAAGRDHCLALRSNGTVAAWGGSSYGQTNVPQSLSNVVAIAAGSYRSYAVKSDGTVTGWGNQPAVPAGLSNVVAVAAGPAQNLALKRDGTVIAWTTTASPLAGVPPGLSNIIAIAAGTQNQALRQDGTVVSWTSASGFSIVTDGNNLLSNAVAIAVGNSVSLGLKQDGTINTDGLVQLQSPISVTNNISSIAAGGVYAGFAVTVIGNGSPNFTLHPYSQIVQRSNTVQLHARAAGVQPMRYQWLLDNLPLPGATNASLILSNVLGKDTGAYRMIASNVLGTVTSQIANISIAFNTNLPAALNATNLQWTTPIERNAAWFAQARDTHDGDVAAQSGATTNGGQSTLQVYVSNPGTLSFWWKTSSEEGYDFLRVYLDQGTTPLFSISGETDWEQKTITFTNTGHSLRWVYSKDGSVSAGRDAGFLDEVKFTVPPPVVTITPANQTVNASASASFFATTLSYDKPITYQWLLNGTNLVGATNQTLSLPGCGRKDQGGYSVRVINSGGGVLVSNATLRVIVHQRLSDLRRLTDGSVELLSRDSTGGEMVGSDLIKFEAQASTNLVEWQTLPGALSVTNGSWLLRDPAAAQSPQRFYRVVEH